MPGSGCQVSGYIGWLLREWAGVIGAFIACLLRALPALGRRTRRLDQCTMVQLARAGATVAGASPTAVFSQRVGFALSLFGRYLRYHTGYTPVNSAAKTVSRGMIRGYASRNAMRAIATTSRVNVCSR
ncbi:MAG: hypothetical protein OHK0022_24380 [Roseiflexaceae bacterium]